MPDAPSPGPAGRPLDRLLDLGKAVLAESAVDRVLTAALDGMVELVGAERGMILLFPPGEGGAEPEPRFEAARNLDRSDLEQPELAVSRSLVRRVRESGEAFFSPNVLDDPTLGHRQSVRRLRLLSVICQPIRRDGETFGVVYLDHRHATGLFSAEAAELAARFAELISLAAHHALERHRLEQRVRDLAGELRERYDLSAIVGRDPALLATLRLVAQVADTDATVLVRGESGTGKELVARALHFNSRRRSGPFVPVNCAALPETLLEAELFGHVRGAFTGALRDNEGWFARARGGTLFLDEVAELPPALQVKLLRVLESGEFSPVGSTRVEGTDARLVAATNRDVEERVRSGALREDFLYRLNVVEVRVPPLRQRRSDVPLLLRHFLDELGKRHGRPGRRFSPAAERLLRTHDYPGNVRELRNAVERALLVADGEVLEPHHLPDALGGGDGASDARSTVADPAAAGAPERPFPEAKRRAVEDFERHYLARCLAASGGNIAAAARHAGIDYKNFYTKVRRLEIDPAEFKAP